MSLNPYQPPTHDAARSEVPANPVYYEMDSTKLTLREYWRMTNGLFEFLVAALMQILRVNVSFKLAFANTTYLQLIHPEHVSEVARKPLRKIVDHAQQLGLQYCFSYVLPTVGDVEAVGAVMIDQQRTTIMVIVFVRSWVNNIRQEKLRYAFVTQLRNDTVLVTSGSPRDLEAPANLLIESYPRRDMQWVLKRHQDRVLETNSPAVPFGDGENLEAEIRRYEQSVFEHQIKRGVYVPVDTAKLEQWHAESSPPPTDSQPTMPAHGFLDVVFWVMLGLSAYLFWQQGPGGNVAQQVLRVSMVAIGIIGISVLWIIRLVRANRSS